MGFTLSCFIFFFFFCYSGMGGMKNPKILGASMNYSFALFFFLLVLFLLSFNMKLILQ